MIISASNCYGSLAPKPDEHDLSFMLELPIMMKIFDRKHVSAKENPEIFQKVDDEGNASRFAFTSVGIKPLAVAPKSQMNLFGFARGTMAQRRVRRASDATDAVRMQRMRRLNADRARRPISRMTRRALLRHFSIMADQRRA